MSKRYFLSSLVLCIIIGLSITNLLHRQAIEATSCRGQAIANNDVAALVASIEAANTTPASDTICLAENGLYLLTDSVCHQSLVISLSKAPMPPSTAPLAPLNFV